jgi:hypothetical protein
MCLEMPPDVGITWPQLQEKKDPVSSDKPRRHHTPPPPIVITDTYIATATTYVLGPPKHVVRNYPPLNYGLAELAVPFLFRQLRWAPFECHFFSKQTTFLRIPSMLCSLWFPPTIDDGCSCACGTAALLLRFRTRE